MHVDSWRSTYKGIISDDYLSNLSVERREKSWQWTFNHLNPDEVTFVAENNEGKIVGFSNSGKSRSPEYNYDAELYAIYILKEYQGQGVGKELVSALLSDLKVNNYKSMMVWVLEGNPSAEFYKRLGGSLFTKKEIQIGEQTLIELAIGWDSLNKIIL
jgi:GNAT superfamily N-acetyltransferase